jgi:hypothetical protein
VFTFVCKLAFFSWSFQYPFFVFEFWHFMYDWHGVVLFWSSRFGVWNVSWHGCLYHML